MRHESVTSQRIIDLKFRDKKIREIPVYRCYKEVENLFFDRLVNLHIRTFMDIAEFFNDRKQIPSIL